jgi:hypothetical protein
MATVKEHVLFSNPDGHVMFSETPAANPCDSPQPTMVTVRLPVEPSSDYGDSPDTMEEHVEILLPVMFVDDAIEEEPDSDLEDNEECGSDMELARSLPYQQSFAGYEDDDDEDEEEEDGCGAKLYVRPYHGALVREGEKTPLLSRFEARSDGPELTDQDELTSYDIQRVVGKAPDCGGSVEEEEDGEAYQRALAGAAGCSPRGSTSSSSSSS